MEYQELESRLSMRAVMNLRGDVAVMESLWARRRIVLTFLRHFG